MASLILVRNVVGELRPKRTLAASRGFLAAARLSCTIHAVVIHSINCMHQLKRLLYCRWVFFSVEVAFDGMNRMWVGSSEHKHLSWIEFDLAKWTHPTVCCLLESQWKAKLNVGCWSRQTTKLPS